MIKTNKVRNLYSIGLAFLCVAWLIPARAGAEAVTAVSGTYGSRALGMGGAFVAVADNAEAIFWNPAGMALPDNDETLALGANISGRDLMKEEWGVFARHESVGTGSLAIGRGDYFLFNMVDIDTTLLDELWYKRQDYQYAVAGELTDNLYAGISIKSLNDTLYNRDSGNSVDASGVGMDLGIIYRWRRQVTLGLMATDITSTVNHLGGSVDLYEYNPITDSYELATSIDSVRHPAIITAGLAVRPADNLTLAFDVYDIGQQISSTEVRAGLEYKPFPAVALRLGSMDGEATWGLGTTLGPVDLDLASLKAGQGDRVLYLSANMIF